MIQGVELENHIVIHPDWALSAGQPPVTAEASHYDSIVTLGG
jgi:hypothetical protein